MRILVACEHSGKVREAFRAKGHDAWSNDTLPAMDNSPFHFQEKLEDLIKRDSKWDMVVAFPPCTYLTNTANRWFTKENLEREPWRIQARQDAIDFFLFIANLVIPKIAIENPIGIMSTQYRKPDQIIHPYQFGHPVQKATCLWLKGLLHLKPTNIVEPEFRILHNGKRISKFHDCWNPKVKKMMRSITFDGIANAMGDEWG